MLVVINIVESAKHKSNVSASALSAIEAVAIILISAIILEIIASVILTLVIYSSDIWRLLMYFSFSDTSVLGVSFVYK